MNCYRFRGSVALGGQYMTPKEARRLARHLQALARDIQSGGVWGDDTPGTLWLEAFEDYTSFREAQKKG